MKIQNERLSANSQVSKNRHEFLHARTIRKETEANYNTLVHFDTTSAYNKLTDLIARYKGHNIFIDLWATWCIPCRMEFPYYKDIKDELKNYDIVPVYLSIDEPTLKNLWKKTAMQSELEGYHVIAGKLLYADIENLLFKDTLVSIPRCILVNKKGELVDINAPRPSNKAKLFKEFKERL